MKAIFITARMNSSRIPNKMLIKFGGTPLIQWDIDKALNSAKTDLIVLCTTEKPDDDILWFLGIKNQIKVFRGSEEDKLSRWLGAAEKYDIDFFINFDGDDPLCDPELIDLAFKQYNQTRPDLILSPETPCGAFSYGIKTAALRKVCKMKDTTDTEMFVPYFTETGKFRVENLRGVPDDLKRPEIRLTIDYPDDARFFSLIYEAFRYRIFDLHLLIEYLDKNPELIKINSHLQKTWAENQKAKTRIVLRDEGTVSSL